MVSVFIILQHNLIIKEIPNIIIDLDYFRAAWSRTLTPTTVRPAPYPSKTTSSTRITLRVNSIVTISKGGSSIFRLRPTPNSKHVPNNLLRIRAEHKQECIWARTPLRNLQQDFPLGQYIQASYQFGEAQEEPRTPTQEGGRQGHEKVQKCLFEWVLRTQLRFRNQAWHLHLLPQDELLAAPSGAQLPSLQRILHRFERPHCQSHWNY